MTRQFEGTENEFVYDSEAGYARLDKKYRAAAPLPLTDLEAENARLRARLAEALKALEVTRSLVSEAAMTGFNCHDGNWAERLYANNGNISEVLSARRVREGGKVDG